MTDEPARPQAHSDDVSRALGEVAFFSHFDEVTRAEVARRCETLHLRAGDWLFRQGDEGDAMFVVLTGRVELVREEPRGAVGVGLLGPGTALGELSPLMGSTRSVSVRAVRDSEVVRIDRVVLNQLLQERHDFAIAVLRAVGTHLQDTGVQARLPRPSSTAVISLVALGDGLPTEEMLTALRAELGRAGSVEVLDDRRVADLVPDPDDLALGRLLDRVERSNAHVLLVSGCDRAVPWDQFCMRQADRTIVLTPPAPPSRLGTSPPTRCDQVIVGRTASVRELAAWSSLLAPRSQQVAHVGPHMASVAARLARRLTRRSVGVVLSGGGARGLAHLGVLSELIAAGVVIDRVGGCSMGAFIGALLGKGLSPDEMARVCRAELVRSNPFNDYTLPRRSLIRGTKAAAMLRRVFGMTCIEELDLDYFAVSADLVAADLVVHRRGPLWQAVGASMSLPGLVQPLSRDGELLVDGGVLDNLPVDVMAATDEGPIVAIDVMGRRQRGQAVGKPSILDTLAWSTMLGSWRRAEHNRTMASMVIAPDVSDTPLLAFDQVDRMVAAGRRAALEELKSAPEWLVRA